MYTYIDIPIEEGKLKNVSAYLYIFIYMYIYVYLYLFT
jgi:hypothetical protein